MGSKWVGEHAGCTPSPFPFLMGRVIAKSSVMALPIGLEGTKLQ